MQISNETTNKLLFAYYYPQFDHRIMVASLTGRRLAQSVTMKVAGRLSSQVRLFPDNDISISGAVQPDAEAQFIRALALGFYPQKIELEGASLGDAFEGILEPMGESASFVKKSLLIETVIPSLFYLPLFQYGVLESAYDSLSGQPFFAPLEQRQLQLAESMALKTGDHIVVQHQGDVCCLALGKERTKGSFEAEVYATADSLSIASDDVLGSKIVRQIDKTEVAFAAEVARVVEVFE